ncbi:MAG: outer membrane lipoprotein chaperone LolA [Pseudohongiellaceae bacterium]
MIYRKRSRGLSALFSVVLLVSCVCARAQHEDTAVSQLIQVLQQTSTMQAQVEQLTLDQNGREIQEADATMVMRKPDHFFWHATAPYEELMTTNGELIWIYEPDLEQVSIQNFQSQVSRTPALLLSTDEAGLQESFHVSVSVLPNNNRTRFVLLPRDPGSLFETLSLTFFNAVLEEMQFEDSLGQKTSLSFRDVVLNEPVDDGLFTFTAPPGIDIIDSTQVSTAPAP